MDVQATKRFSQRLRERMESAGISQSDLARQVGAGRPGLNRILRGKQVPTLEMADRLADAVGLPLAELISENSSHRS